jgi:hypothetical protein
MLVVMFLAPLSLLGGPWGLLSIPMLVAAAVALVTALRLRAASRP